MDDPTSRLALVLLGLLATGTLATAGDSAADAGADTFTGNWGGLRPALAAHGVTFSGSYIAETLGNVTGGRRRGAIYDGLLEAGLDVDADKLVGWPGFTAHFAGIDPHGSSLSARDVGDLGLVSSIDAYDSLRLYEAWVEQKVFAERFALRVGFLAADADFGVLEMATPFIHSAFGTPTVVADNFAMSTYPYSGLGARLRIAPAPGWSVLLGAYDGNVAPGVFPDPSPGAAPSNEFNHYGTHFALRTDEGAMLFAEIGWRIAPAEDDAKAGPRPYAGNYKVGGVYHTDEFTEIGDTVSGRVNPRGVHGNSAFYLSGEQEIWRGSVKGESLGAFARAAFAPRDRNLFQNSCEAGLVYAGLWQSEGRDHLACGFSCYEISDRLAEAQRRAGVPVQDYEAVVELTYQYQLPHGCTLQPDAQWVIHPGASDAVRDALVLGMRITVAF